MITMLLLAVFLASPIQAASSTEERILQGDVESVDGSPVRIIEAHALVIDKYPTPKQSKLVKEAVKLENISGRKIRRLYLDCSLEYASGGIMTNRRAVDLLDVGEMRLDENPKISITWYSEKNDIAYWVRPTGAEFEDGSHWAAPRTIKHPFMRGALSKQNSPIAFAEWNWADGPYEATLRFHFNNVAAYRLGVIEDTPGGFNIKIGRWITLKGSIPDRGSNIKIKATDESASLTPDEMFPRTSYTRLTRRGTAITSPGGVAVFIAEVEFADGKIWRQSTKREDLLWDN